MVITTSLFFQLFVFQESVDPSLVVVNIVFESGDVVLDVLDFDQHFGLGLLSLEGFPHTVSYGGLV